MSFKPIYIDRSQNSDLHVGGIITFLCDSDADVSNLPKGLPTETGNTTPLPGSVAIIPNPKKLYVLDNNNTWVAVE